MSIQTISRTERNFRTEKDIVEFAFEPSEETRAGAPFQNGTYMASSMKVTRDFKDGVENLAISVWGEMGQNAFYVSSGQWSTKVSPLNKSHVLYAPFWVHEFIRDNTTFGALLDSTLVDA